MAEPVKRGETMEILKRALRHPDPPQLWYQLREIVESRIYLRHGIAVHEGDTVLDVGANVGVAAAFFAVECGAGTVHSFEPVAPIFNQLRENLSQFAVCVAHPYGLSSRSRGAEIVYYPEDWAMSGLYADPAADRAVVHRSLLNLGFSEVEAQARLKDRYRIEILPCELRTISEVLRSESIERVDLLKIDVEKAEVDVLAGVEEADWPAIRQVVAEVHLERRQRSELSAELARRGFDVTVDQDPTMIGTPIHILYASR